MKKSISFLLLMLVASYVYSQSDYHNTQISLNTNITYLVFSTITSYSLLILPIEIEEKITDEINTSQALTLLIFNTKSTTYTGSMLLTEFGISFGPHGCFNTGWKFDIIPGIAYAFDNSKIGFSILGEVGYQWIIKNKIKLGVFGGIRDVYMEGNLIMPDLKIKLGYQF